MSPAKAVLIGHAWINIPVLLLIGLGAVLASPLNAGASIGALVGAAIG